MMFGTRCSSLRLGITLGALCASLGCSSLPTAPQIGRETPARAEELRVPGAALIQSATSSKVINGTLGGIVSAGRFKLLVPPLAIPGNATVTVTQSDLSKLVVDLSITPASANRFRVPVVLLANASQLDRKTLSASYISWFNPSTGRWQQVPGSSIDLKFLTVQAPLFHFSTYRVESKAGW